MIAAGQGNYAWVSPHQFDQFAFPTVQMKIWAAYQEYVKAKE